MTDVFTSYFGEDTNPRVKEVLSALARHMHDFAREVNLTHDEWQTGIE
ncbi:MAG: hydroxyquinol 1,2-dioxygenase, partial [Shimia sp.]|nr:hydroxyquinol 1,2-dioxygenase [Shimia sp.]